MKKLLSVAVALLLTFQVQAGMVPTCRCAGRCSMGSVCNCATNSCMVRKNTRYAYGYVDTMSPVYTQNYNVSPVYQTAPYTYTGEPGRKYSLGRSRPYFAGRFMLSKALSDFEHQMTVDGLGRGSYKEDVDDMVYGGALAFGVNVDNFRLELEGSVNTQAEAEYDHVPMVGPYFQDKLKHKIQTMALLVNAYYDFRNTTSLTPYLGAGLGVGHIKSKIKAYDPSPSGRFLDIDSHSENTTNFIWQIGAGLSYALDEGTNLDIGYRFTDYGKMDVMDWEGALEGGVCARERLNLKKFRTHTLNLGVRVDL